ncbi:MAG: nickel-responsive transcriptional regulator NikR [Candidatus Binatia bacterium]
MKELVRVSITIEQKLLERFDALIKASGGGNRSEALRDLVRDRLLEQEASQGQGSAVGTVTLVYDHRRRHLAEQLTDAGHQHHHEILASMHVHLDHDHCLEVVAMSGKRGVLRRVADAMIGMKGVLHGKLVLSGVAGAPARRHSHSHRGHAVAALFLAGSLFLPAESTRADDVAPAATSVTEDGSPASAGAATEEEEESTNDDTSLPPVGASTTLQPLLVEGRAENLVGIARSGSEGVVGAEQLETRPVLRNAELLEVIPGLLATQHSGSGKANQYFLRGFNLDHGTDFSTRIEGVPMNLPTSGHGQGYLDLNGVIPELVRTVRYHKGPYYAETGDFSSAGSAYIELYDRLERGIAEVEGGMFGFGRAVLANSSLLAGGDLLYAAEVNYYDGPWKVDEEAIKGNAVLKWTRGDRDRGVQLFASAYTADWNATDQIPLRAVRDGSLPRRGAVDPTDGGDTSRYTVAGSAWRSGEQSRTHGKVYGVYYALDLFSNFTYFLEDQVSGDQIHQHDRRGIFGGDVEHDWYGKVAGFDHESRVGLSLRHDYIPSVALRRSTRRQRLFTVREDNVNETMLAVWGDSTITLLEKLRVVPGLRLDGYHFDVDSDLDANSGTKFDGIVSPKIAVVAGPWRETEAYFNFGTGFHSNDARGTTIRVDPLSGENVSSVDPLVRSIGYEIGVRTETVDGLHSSVALWLLDLDSELVFVGDAGTTEPGPSSRRYGVEWSNYYEPWTQTAIDFDVSYTHARFDDVPDSENEIPGAIPLVISGGVVQRFPFDLFAALRLRYLGDYPLIEDGSQDSGATTLVNLRLGWDQAPADGAGPSKGDWAAHIDFLNLFNSRDRDIAYYYESRLAGEDAGVEDIHFHPVEPFAVRVGIERRF